MQTTRRQFLASTFGSATLVSLSSGVPGFLLQASAEERAKTGDQVLVVVQLTGGNDGLNTVVPYADDVYQRSRKTLAIPASSVLKIDDYLGFHPSLQGFARLLENQRLSIVQGVGYPDPDRSHFSSMDIWHTARRTPGPNPLGWLGRYLDDALKGRAGDVPALHLGPEDQPLALASEEVHATSVQSIERFKLEFGRGGQVRRAIEQAVSAKRDGSDDLLSFVQDNTASALVSSERVEEVIGQYKTPVEYPKSDLGKKLSTIAQMIDSGMSTRVYYVALDGFDTHSTQDAAHAGLLTQLGDAASAFYEDLAHHDHADRVLTLSFSEFGRRVEENASKGTDHGAAAPMFLMGGRVKPGPFGKHPSLKDLVDGDLKHHTDFRQVYATVLEDWLSWNSETILGGKYDKLQLFG